MYKPELTQEQIKKLYSYDFRTGKLYRVGKEHLGAIEAEKVWVKFKNGQMRQYTTAKIIWCYMKGDWEKYVMRIDKDPTNNNWNNFKIKQPMKYTF